MKTQGSSKYLIIKGVLIYLNIEPDRPDLQKVKPNPKPIQKKEAGSDSDDDE